MSKAKPNLSLIIAASDGLELTLQAVRSASEFTKTPHEIIVIDNASTDGTSAWLTSQKDVITFRFDKLVSYSKAINKGLEMASKSSNYLAVLNNDLVFTEGWDVKLIESINHPEWLPGVDKIGIAGPMSNHVAGFQFIQGNYAMPQLQEYARNLETATKSNKGVPFVTRAGFLSGFCWIMTRECYEAVGGLDDLNGWKVDNLEMPLGFEDNDFVLRAEIAGFASVICKYSYVHHFGGQTTYRLKQDFAQRGMKNRVPFYNKWRVINTEPKKFLEFNSPSKDVTISKHPIYKKKLVAGYRVKNVDPWFERVLTKMSEVADDIVIFDDHSTDNTLKIAKKFPKVVTIHNSEYDTFNEARDREHLLKLCKERNPDWIIITDGDEELEAKFDRNAAEKLMNPIKPSLYAYIFRYITHWDSEELQRTDGIFGHMANVRMIRNLPNQHIVSNHPQGLHCNSVPWIPVENVMITPYRIRHYGYIEPERRMEKFEWYQSMDTDKRPNMIGSEDYSHLADTKVQTVKYKSDITLGLTMIVKNEEENLEAFLDAYHCIFHEMVIVDTGSKDKTIEIAKRYGAKVYEYSWDDDFSTARNFAKTRSTATWCFQLDPDERLGDDLFRFYRMIEEPVIGYIFPVVNYLPSGKSFISENGRLFRNMPEIFYSGTVHESVNEQLAKIKGKGKTVFVANPKEALHHYGYLKNPLAIEKKLRKYARICEKVLANNPNDGMAHFSLALHCLNEGSEEKGEYHFKQAMIHAPKLTQSHQQLANLYLRKARRCLEQAVEKTNPAHPVFQGSFNMLQAIKPFSEEVEIVGMPMRGNGK